MLKSLLSTSLSCRPKITRLHSETHMHNNSLRKITHHPCSIYLSRRTLSTQLNVKSHPLSLLFLQKNNPVAYLRARMLSSHFRIVKLTIPSLHLAPPQIRTDDSSHRPKPETLQTPRSTLNSIFLATKQHFQPPFPALNSPLLGPAQVSTLT